MKDNEFKPGNNGQETNQLLPQNKKGNNQVPVPKNDDNWKKGKRNKNRYRNSGSKGREGDKNKPSRNDSSWYYPDETIGRAFANLPYNVMTGMPMHLNLDAAQDLSTVPGVATIVYSPSYGSFNLPGDSINVAARAIFSFVRKFNSGSTNYESSDLMTYFMAMDNVYDLMLFVRKMLGLVGNYHFTNRTIPQRAFAHARIDLADAEAKRANYIGYYNILCDKVNRQFAVPNVFKVFNRRAHLQSALFGDSTSIRGQVFNFVPAWYYHWVGTAEGGSSLNPVETPYTSTAVSNPTFGTWLDFLNAIIEELIAEQDFSIMSGDILKAYGSEQCFALQPIGLDHTTVAVYDETVLNQIENMVFCDYMGPDANKSRFQFTPGIISQSNNLLRCENLAMPTSEATLPDMAVQQFMLNSHKDEPDWKDNLEFSRMMVGFDKGNSGYILNNGTELFYAIIYDMYVTKNDSGTTSVYEYRITGNILNITDIDTVVMVATFTNVFDWAPFMYFYGERSGNSGHAYIPLGDYKVSTPITNTVLKNLHDCARLAMFDASMRSIKP